MATSVWPTVTAATDVTALAKFIPELWSDEVVAAYKSNLVMANLVSRMNHRGRKGDTVHIPAPYRGDATAKAAETGVTIQNSAETEVLITINKHWEYSRLIEDIASLQALGTARMFYTDDAGYSLARRTDRDIWLQTHYLNAGNTTPAANNLFETGVIGGNGSTAFLHSDGVGNGTALTDVGIRTVIQKLDDNDVPMSERYLVIPPIEKKSLTGIPRFTEQAFVGEAGAGNTIRNGLVGDVYGVKVYVSSNCPWVHVNEDTDTASVTFNSTVPTSASFVDEFGIEVDWSTGAPPGVAYRVCAMLHKSALVLVEQMGVRMQTQYKQEFLSDLMTADTIYGTGRLRDGNVANTSTAGYAIIVPAI